MIRSASALRDVKRTRSPKNFGPMRTKNVVAIRMAFGSHSRAKSSRGQMSTCGQIDTVDRLDTLAARSAIAEAIAQGDSDRSARAVSDMLHPDAAGTYKPSTPGAVVVVSRCTGRSQGHGSGMMPAGKGPRPREV